MIEKEVNRHNVAENVSKVIQFLRFTRWGAACLFGLSCITYAMVSREQTVSSFEVHPDGKTEEFFAMTQRFLPNDAVERFAASCAISIYTMRGDRPDLTMTEAQKCLTPDGFEQFEASTESNGVVEYLRSNGVVSIPTLTGPAIVESTGIINGNDVWLVRLPLRVDYVGRKQAVKKMILSMVVARTRPGTTLAGMGVTKIDPQEL